MSKKKLTHKEREMAICFVGTLVPEKWYNELQKRSKIKAAGSPVFMQKLLYRGLREELKNVSVFSYPPIATYPNGALLGYMGGKKIVEDDACVNVIPFLNVAILKQMTIFVSMFFSLIHWNMKNRNKARSIFVYADFLEYCLPAYLVSKMFNNSISLFLTELPGYEHYHSGKKTIKDKIIIRYERMKKRFHKCFDGYVFVSENLREVVNVGNSPWVVVEGIADKEFLNKTADINAVKEKKKTVMYAGSFGEAYNVKMLIDAFHNMKQDYVLWLFGDGKYASYAKEIAEIDERIKYFGKVDREEVIKAEKKAHVLIHAKDPYDPHSKYAFSSKILEYMASGTPVLSTEVLGVPKEYYNYVYKIVSPTIEGIQKALLDVLSLSSEDLDRQGKIAKEFIFEEKNQHKQAKKIIDMMKIIQVI